MLAMIVETQFWSFLTLLAFAFVLGAAIAWVAPRRRWRGSTVDPSDNEALYLIVSRLSHRLKTVGEVVRSENGASVPHLSGDEAVLPEVFSNVIENAVKHNDAGTQVNSEVKNAGRRMEINISDTGSGIAPGLLATMFARGNRRYARGEVRGIGMGMYVCKLLVELHGGTLSAESKQGQGTTFTISLPMRRSGR